jgi:ADP-heptose:LPS heptosyltransferase
MVGFDLTERDKQGWIDPETGYTEWEASRIARRVQDFEQVDLEAENNWDLRLTESEERVARALLCKVNDKTKLLAVGVGTKVPAKDWGVENWRTLLARISAEFPDWTAVFYGSAEEEHLSSECARQWRGPSINACGIASPRESAAVLRQCRLFVGHDSGPMHLAACVGTPCVAIFSARNLPRQWFPRGESNAVIYHRTDCAGCGLEKCIVEGKKCLRSITVDEVMAYVRKTMSETA